MATKDVNPQLWTDPWFLSLPPETKALYLWLLTSNHSHPSGLFVVAESVMCFEVGDRAGESVEELDQADKVRYAPLNGGVWVIGAAKRVRVKSQQMAKAIYAAWEHFPDLKIKSEFVEKYRNGWFVPELDGELQVNFTRTSPELQLSHEQAKKLNFTRTSGEVLGQSQGQGQAVKGFEEDLKQEEETSLATPEAIGIAFDELRLAYPIVGTVEAAQNAYFDLVRPSPQLIVDIKLGLKRWKTSAEWSKLLAEDNIDRIPRLATWLKARRWEETPPQSLRVVAVAGQTQTVDPAKAEAFWNYLRDNLGDTDFELNIQPARIDGSNANRLILSAPRRSVGWLNTRYRSVLLAAAVEAGFEDVEVFEAVKAA